MKNPSSSIAVSIGLFVLVIVAVVGAIHTKNQIIQNTSEQFQELSNEIDSTMQEISDSHKEIADLNDLIFRTLQKSYYKENCITPEDKEQDVCNPEYYGDIIDEINAET